MAREWLDRGMAAASPIDAFRDFWIGFNSLYASALKVPERAKIEIYLNAMVPVAVASQFIANHPTQIQYLLSQPVIDMRGNGKDTGPDIIRYNTSNNDLEKLISLFMVIYQVRCNLEHGQKLPSNPRDFRLCEDSAPIVHSVLQHCA
jgi:hypothetical protein